MRTRRLARFAPTVSAVAVLAVLAGCGGSSAEQQSPADAMDRIAAGSAGTESAAYSFEFDDGAGTVMSGQGSFDTAPERALEVEFEESSASGGAPAAAIHMLYVGDAAYSPVPDVARAVPGLAGKWMRLAGPTLGPEIEQFSLMFGDSGLADPRQQVELLRAAGDMREAGSAVIEGVATTRYDADLTPREITTSNVSPGLRESLTEDTPEAEWDDAGRMSVWVDQDFRAHRFEAVLPGESGVDGLLRITARATGDAVQLSAPAAADVLDDAAVEVFQRLGERMAEGTETEADVRRGQDMVAELTRRAQAGSGA